MRRAFLLAGLAGAAALVALGFARRANAAEGASLEVPDLGGLLGDVADGLLGDSVNADANVAAFLTMIGRSEGADYDTLYGGGKFSSFADHPRQKITAGAYTSTAAGRYQILARTWDDFLASQGPHAFDPAGQDACAVWLIARRGALADVKGGRFDVAVAKCGAEWASLPGSPYGQRTNTLTDVRAWYALAGGVYA